MIRNKNIIYNPTEILVPVKLNFGETILNKIMEYKDIACAINAATQETLTYGALAQQAMNIAVSLTQLGVRKGDTIALFSSNRNEFMSTVLGVICAGAALTTVNTGYTTGELKHVLNISKPKMIICSPETYKLHAKILQSTDSIKRIIVFGSDIFENTIPYSSLAFANINKTNKDEIFDKRNKMLLRNIDFDEFEVPEVNGQTKTVLILYSSGTTGMPKGVMLTHLNVLTACLAPSVFTRKDVVLSINPWYHSMGLVTVLLYLTKGRLIVYLPKFSVDQYLQTIEKYKIKQLTVVPPVLVVLCKTDFQYDVSSVKIINSGAAPLHSDTVSDVSKKFPNATVIQGYGLTESTLAATRDNMDDPKQGSVGYPTPGIAIKIADLQTGEALGPHQRGEVCIKGPVIMKGYIGVEDKHWRDEQGFFHSGDIGYYDQDGCFFIVDRLKELIKYKGYQVPPAEIEGVLLTHPSVNDVGVVAREHREAGEVPVAFVVRQPGSSVGEEELKRFVADRLSNPKHLRGGVRFMDAIPKSVSGKILRRELKKMLKNSKSKL